jgi:GrpB-like predicted nucleotidyltransferase (UPF0157 family)
VDEVLGLERGYVRLIRYQSEWARLFELEKSRLQLALGDGVLDIQHIGSTAVPGLVAKPILDIAIAVCDFESARSLIPAIESIGYTYRGEVGIPRRHYFVKGDPRTHHIHMLEQASQEWTHLLIFRNTLQDDPNLAQQYANLKERLAAQYPNDREAYLKGKAVFIEDVINKA